MFGSKTWDKWELKRKTTKYSSDLGDLATNVTIDLHLRECTNRKMKRTNNKTTSEANVSVRG